MDIECQPCGIFEGLLYHQEDEVIDPIIFAADAGLENIIKIVSSVSVIFDTVVTY